MHTKQSDYVRELAVELDDARASHEHVHSEKVPVLGRDDHTVARPDDPSGCHSYSREIAC